MATKVRNERVDELVREAKNPVSVLAGPYGHPFHPILVTVPIGAWVCALIFDIATRVSDAGSSALVEASYWLIGIGIVGALVAAIFGLLDLLSIPRRTRAFTTGLVHMTLNVTVVGLFVVNFVWRHNDYDELTKVKAGQLILSAATIAVLGVSGWLGGMLAYHFGVRVADEVRQADGFRRGSAPERRTDV
jgi:uncharacterized membrane protein